MAGAARALAPTPATPAAATRGDAGKARSAAEPATAKPALVAQDARLSTLLPAPPTPTPAPAAVAANEPLAAPAQPPSLLDRAAAAVGEALEFSESVAWALLDSVAPQLTPIVRKGPEGVLDWLKEQVGAAVDTVVDTLMAPVRSLAGTGRQLSGAFAPLQAWLQDAVDRIARNDCTPLREAADKIEQAATALVEPIVNTLQPVVAKVQGFFNGVWERFGAPIWESIQKFASQQWAQIEGLARWVWDQTEPMRLRLRQAWVWLKNKLGIGDGPEGRDGILQWVQARLAQAWDWLKAKLGPYQKEITVIAGVVGGLALLLSPAGPVVLAAGAVVGLVQGLRWVRANWGKGVVQARSYVEKTLLPGLLGASTALAARLVGLSTALPGGLRALAGGMARLVGAASGLALQAVTGAARWLSEQVDALAQWAREQLAAASQWLQQALARLQQFGQRMIDFLAAVGRAASDVYAIQGKVLKALWDLIPSCIRDPVVDYLVPLILRQVELFQELVRDNEAWQKTKAEVLNIVKLVFEDHDLQGALKAVFQLFLRTFNIPPELLPTIRQKAISAWAVVSKRPLAFLKNMMRAVGHGFGLLWKNINGHLTYGLERWLIGPLADKGIQPPSSWTDAKAVFGFAIDVMGLSMDHMFELLKKRFEPAKVDRLRSIYAKVAKAWAWVQQAIDTSKSPAENTQGIVEQAKGFAATLLSGLAEWIAGKVATELAAYAAAAAASAGISAVLDAFRRIYTAMLTAKRWMRQILDMVNEALDDVAAVASGAIDKVGGKFEQLLHRGMPVVIGFLGDQVGLGGLPAQLRVLVDKLRAQVDVALLWLIDKLKAMLDALVSGAKALLKWWQEKVGFRTQDGQEHEIYADGPIESAEIFVESQKTALGDLIAAIPDAGDKTAAQALHGVIRQLIVDGRQAKTDVAQNDIAAKMKQQLKAMAQLLDKSGVMELKMLKTPTYSYETDSQGRAKKAVVKDLSSLRPLGSTPGTSNPPGWSFAQATGLVHKWPYFRRLHLINHRFGGPGANDNLAVAGNADNSDHLNSVEEKIKEIVGDEPNAPNTGGVVTKYVVEVDYSRAGRKLKKKGETALLSEFPTAFICTWTVKPFGKPKKDVGPVTVDFNQGQWEQTVKDASE